ncbi:MAG: MvaI/BcnI family restriction endonuclease [Endomicrobia bacterium]|nr:MvaI/BcnI family restriction endonuclease [Endomicrobiia bacterium]
MKIFTKHELIEKLKAIRELGWIRNTRKGNDGSVGNMLEDLLGIEENNLPIPNSAEWELKCQRKKTNSMTTLFHMEPSPRALKIVPSLLLPKYGWEHKEAGKKYPLNEKSFRQTISTRERSDRGFKVAVDKSEKKVLISFDVSAVSKNHKKWLDGVVDKVGNTELNPQPYWGFEDLFHHAGTKLHNCFYILADTKTDKRTAFFKYENIYKLSGLSLEKFIDAIERGDILIDFDARTGHNHGTKIRCRNSEILKTLYSEVEEI